MTSRDDIVARDWTNRETLVASLRELNISALRPDQVEELYLIASSKKVSTTQLSEAIREALQGGL